MVNVVVSSQEIQRQLADVVVRTNEKIIGMNQLPEMVRQQIDMQIFDDIEFLFKYINALHGILQEVTDDPSIGKFDFG